MKIIALAQQKGGTSKSTLAIHMSVYLHQRKKRVAILDLDPQGTALKWAQRREGKPPVVIAADARDLQQKLAELKTDGFDFVVLDLPGRRAPFVTDALMVADFTVIPARPFDVDIEASAETIDTMQRIGRPYALAMAAVPPRSNRAQLFTESLRRHGLPVMDATTTELLGYPDAISEGLGVTEYEPRGRAADEIGAFALEVLKRSKG